MTTSLTIHLIAIGGNSENGLAAGPQSMREMSSGANGGELGAALTTPIRLQTKRPIKVDATYYSWTGTPRDNTWWLALPFVHWFGAPRVAARERASVRGERADAVFVVGWSNGGDTAYNIARRLGQMGKVDLLMTLDPVSRVTSLHWLPFNGTFNKPDGVDTWLHAYPTSWGASWKKAKADEAASVPLQSIAAHRERASRHQAQPYHLGNVIAGVGGAWDSQIKADANICIPGSHGDTRAMIRRLVDTKAYLELARIIAGRTG